MTTPAPTPPAEGPAPSRVDRGLVAILAATVVSGGIGYLIQALVPAFVAQADYLAFGVLWATVYLLVSGASGLQQEVTRAADSSAQPRPGSWRTLLVFGGASAVTLAALVLLTGPLWGGAVFRMEAPTLVTATAVAIGGYALVATLSGAFYGIGALRTVAGMTVVDVALRAAAIAVALLLGAGIAGLSWAVALPFLAAFALFFALTARRIRRGLSLDAGPGRLARNSLSTVGAAIATGVLISSLPLLLGVLAPGLSPEVLAALILVVNLTRAPLVVPLLALQSYLVVRFRDAPERVPRSLLVWGALLAGITAVVALGATLLGPPLVGLLYGPLYALPAGVYTGVVASAGTTAALCLTGPALLAAGRHGRYIAGWATAAAALVAGLAVTALSGATGTALLWTVLILAVAPLAGVAVHLAGLRRAR